MVAHVHSVLDHALVGLIVQKHQKHVSNKSIPLVEGAPAIDDRLGGIGTQDKRAYQRLLPFPRDDKRVEHQPARTL